ncbi:YfhO family protein [Liquorilactobacillus oeni]|uniref:Integral membrane protein n=1 Tax=Liquorilactobacillus oeni DSM 19972 TaxID=1423777 RepID=A0A0R1M8J5_9LACO|nr:YfhO family protein [Liquorilactobacillus oeni]KRL04479.1 hypothetical protein FD46_GL001609 [Liquorilactobacillus oeni DSM 19972]
MENWEKQRISTFKTYFLAGILPLFLMILVWIVKGIVPFGTNNFLVSDLGTQYIPFLTEMRRQILTGQINAYSFSLGLGDNFFPVAAYYLMSPFNLICLFFRSEQVPLAVEFIILLKISAMGLTFAHYLLQKCPQRKQIWLFATVYALNGFVAMNFYNIMWLDALIWLPLVVLGLERLTLQGKRCLFVISLTIAIFCNYYLGYMIVLFTACYLCYLLGQREHTGKQVIRILLTYFKTLVQVVLLVSCLLLPTFLGMQKTAKTGIKANWFLPLPEFGISFFKQMGVSGSSYLQRLDHAPSVFMGSLVVILAVFYFLDSRCNKKEKKAAFLLLSFLFLSLWLRPLNTIWHLMNRPAGFPYRNSIFLIFFTISLAAERWQLSQHFDKRKMLLVAGIFGSLLLINIVFVPSDYFWVLLSFAGIGLVASALVFLQGRVQNAVLIIVTLAALSANLYGSMAGMKLGNQNSYESSYINIQKKILQADPKKTISYRLLGRGNFFTHAYRQTYNDYNDGLLLGYEGLSLYSSTLDKSVRRFLINMGYFSKNVRRISSIGGSDFSDSLLNVRYYLSQKDKSIKIIRNPTAIGNGLLTSAAIKKGSFNKRNIFENQEKIWKILLPGEKTLFQNVQVLKVKRLERDKYLVKIKAPAAGILYCAQNYLDEDGTQQQVLKKIKKIRGTETIQIKLSSYSRKQFKSKNLKILNQARLLAGMKKLKKNEFQLKHKNGSSWLIGETKNIDTKRMLTFSIPFDTGWQVFCNGKKLKTTRSLGTFLAVSLPKGNSKIILHYQTPGSRAGLILSLLGTFWLGIEWLLLRKKSSS